MHYRGEAGITNNFVEFKKKKVKPKDRSKSSLVQVTVANKQIM